MISGSPSYLDAVERRIGLFLLLICCSLCRQPTHAQSPDEINHGQVRSLSTVGKAGVFVHEFPADSGYFYREDDVIHVLIRGELTTEAPPGTHGWRTFSAYMRVEPTNKVGKGYRAYFGSGFFRLAIPHLESEIHCSAGVFVEQVSERILRLSGLLKEQAQYYDDRFELPDSLAFKEFRVEQVANATEFEKASLDLWHQIRNMFVDPKGLTYHHSGRWTRTENGEVVVLERGIDESEVFEMIDDVVRGREQER